MPFTTSPRIHIEHVNLINGVTANATSDTKLGLPEAKTFWGEVVGTGAVTATIKIYGARTATAANGVLVATITLSGTTTAVDAATPSFAVYPYYYVVVENLTGTGATARAEAFF